MYVIKPGKIHYLLEYICLTLNIARISCFIRNVRASPINKLCFPFKYLLSTEKHLPYFTKKYGWVCYIFYSLPPRKALTIRSLYIRFSNPAGIPSSKYDLTFNSFQNNGWGGDNAL